MNLNEHSSRRRGRWIAVAVALAIGSPAAAAPAVPVAASHSPNAVVVWDLHAQTAIWDIAAQQPQTVSQRSFAMVSGAVYDAVNAIAGTPYEPYLIAPPARGDESIDAAVATAAHRVLVSLFPEQRRRLWTQYRDYLDDLPDGRSTWGGVAVGARAAHAMTRARANDGAFGDQSWPVGEEPGQWRPTPPGFVNAGAWIAEMTPFLIPDPSAFGTDGPPELTSLAYARDVNEIKRIGSVDSTVRTADQTEAAQWWHDRRSAGWEIKRQLAVTQRLNPVETARLFAMVDFAGADSSIACGDEKVRWSFWRPLHAIQLADTDGNRRTKADPDWQPLIVNPPLPDYPSGATCGVGARLTAAAHVFGTDKVAYSGFSEATGTRRHFDSFSDGIAEVVEARIWAGIHFRTANVNGAGIGVEVADYIAEHHFLPLR